jgi:putative membrane protein insertion efficiency factor
MNKLLILLVRVYRIAISPMIAPRCRFLPTCSDYAVQALERHGAWTGAGLALRRLLRCHPFQVGGIDEVPPTGQAGWRCTCKRTHAGSSIDR